MAQLTYTVFSGELVCLSESGGDMEIAFCESGFSNLWWDSRQKEQGKFGTKGHVRGGPIPNGRWRVLRPGSVHPDGGKLRPNWIPVGPVRGRTSIYLHPAGTRTEGCIAVTRNFERVRELVRRDGGGWLTVIGGDIV
jgi:hypothetical protein